LYIFYFVIFFVMIFFFLHFSSVGIPIRSDQNLSANQADPFDRLF